MEKFARILFIIFLVSIINIVISSYIVFNLNKINRVTYKNDSKETESYSPIPVASSKPVIPPSTDIKSDLNTIKAEIRSLRESLTNSGLVITDQQTKTNNNE